MPGCDCNKDNCKDQLCDEDNRCEITVREGTTKAFCMCGLSQDKPYCDGSHTMTDCLPRVEMFHENKAVYICNCGKTKDKPFCDGACGKESKKILK